MGRIEELYQRLEREYQSMARNNRWGECRRFAGRMAGNRWGECRRFAGRMAGNRLDRIAHIRQMIDKEYARNANPK